MDYNKFANDVCSLNWDNLGEYVGEIEFECKENDGFKKFFNSALVEKVVDQYRCAKISGTDLAHWAYMYLYLINDGFKDIEPGSVKIEQVIQEEISDWLDSLTFFIGDEDFYDLDAYVNALKTLEKMLNNVSNYNCTVFLESKEKDEEIYTFVIKSLQDKSYYVIKSDYFCIADFALKINDNAQFEPFIQSLIDDGYCAKALSD